MAKNMAQIEAGAVSNILWCSDREPETETLKDCLNFPVTIGDTYENGRFYHEGEMYLTPLEAVEQERDELMETMAQMIEEIYLQDDEVIEE